MICAIASNITSQAQAIREATLKSLLARDLYSEQVAHQLTQSLKTAQEQVRKALLGYKGIGSLPDSKLTAFKGIEKLDAEIRETLRNLRKDHTLMFRNASRTGFRSGVYRGIEEFAAAQMPFYKDLTPDGIDRLTTSVFTLIDTDALDFMANYNLVLAGDVHRELSDGIKRTILSGIATGKGTDDIVRDLGRVIEDKESFRHAGSKVFSKAQYRMEMIARTEVLRAHNQGRIKFHREVGVQKLEWLAMEDERMCPVCGGLDGKVFDTDHFPSQPAHPNCRCTSVVAWPLVICGADTSSQVQQSTPSITIPANPRAFTSAQPTNVELGLHDQLWEKHGEIIESLNTAEHQALQGYIRGKCNDIVSQSRGKLKDPKLQKYATAIEAILDRSELTAPTRVYRGDGRLPNDPVKAKALIGSKIENPGFVSTSIRAHVGNQFSGATGGVLELDLPAGTHALYAGAFWRSKKAVDSRKKGAIGEAEVLLPPGIDFEITAARIEDTVFGKKTVYTATPLLKPEHIASNTSAKAERTALLYACALETKTGEGAACILPPQAIEFQAQQKIEEEKKLKSVFESGQISDLSTLTVKHLQTLAKQNSIAIARTKSDFIKLLDQAEPGIHHGDLSGTALQAKIKQYNIAALRSKDELAKLLAEKQTVLKQAKALEEAAKNAAPQTDLSNLTMVQLKDMAKQHGVSLNLTKSEVIEMLDGLEPGVDHSDLAGKALIAAKQKHGIPPLKNKEQLVKALEKSAGQQMAEQAKQKTLDVAKQEALKKAEQALKDSTSQIVMPSSPVQYSSFLDSVKAAEAELAKDSGLSASVLQEHAKEIALKKHTFAQQVSAMKSGELKDLAKQTKIKHWQWSSKDELITLFAETDPTKVSNALASIEAKHAKWAEKHLAKPGKMVQPKTKPAAPQSAPQPVTSVPLNTFTKKGSEFDAVDTAWAEHGKPEKFKYVGKANVGGAHAKEFWLDKSGDKWLFKPVGKSTDDFIAHGEESAYKIGRLIDPDAMEVRTIHLNGRTGSIQRWHGGLATKSDFSSFDVMELSADDIAQVQREHVIDWLISNHDGHAKQFLRAKSGKVYGIDKAQLFKFLGSDKLAIDYHPNGACGESEPFYNTLFRAVKQGKVTVDPSVTLRYIREVERISDDDYLALVGPYIEGRFGRDELQKRAFYDLALARKHNLRSDFESFYTDVLGKKGFKFEDVAEVQTAVRISKSEEQIIEEARILGWQGKSLPIDEFDIEDQNALVFTETVKGRARTVVKMKLRPESEAKILPALRKSSRQISAVKVGEPLAEDEFADDILLAVKTINYHAQDGNYNKSKVDKLNKHLIALKKLAKSDDPDVREMAATYIGWIERTQEAAREKGSVAGKFETYLRKSLPPKSEIRNVDFTVRKTKVLMEKRTLAKGELSIEKDSVGNSSMFRGRSMNDGEQYEVDFGDGVRAVYRPWSEKNHYAQRGELEIIVDERPDSKSLDKALGNIEKLGLKTNIATADDAEIMYLTKQAYIAKADRDSDYLRMISTLDGRNATKTERIQTMRGFWEKRFGVSDITRMPGYDPVGEYQLGFKNAKITGGYRHQYRFDISDADLEKQMKGYSLYHNLTNGESVSEFLDTVLENNGAMISTIEKLRAGVMPGGMSPESDMNSGGASYVFTRIKKSPTASSTDVGLYFKKRLLRRMDAVSYNHDAFGKVKDDYVTSNRGSDPATWKSFSRNSSNETIFKHSITLLDNMESIVVHSNLEKKKVLDVFKKHGISTLPDGRKVEELVVGR